MLTNSSLWTSLFDPSHRSSHKRIYRARKATSAANTPVSPGAACEAALKVELGDEALEAVPESLLDMVAVPVALPDIDIVAELEGIWPSPSARVALATRG